MTPFTPKETAKPVSQPTQAPDTDNAQPQTKPALKGPIWGKAKWGEAKWGKSNP